MRLQPSLCMCCINTNLNLGQKDEIFDLSISKLEQAGDKFGLLIGQWCSLYKVAFSVEHMY